MWKKLGLNILKLNISVYNWEQNMLMVMLVLMNHQIAKCAGSGGAAYVACVYIYIFEHKHRVLVCISRIMLVCRSDCPLDCYGDSQLIWIRGPINVWIREFRWQIRNICMYELYCDVNP